MDTYIATYGPWALGMFPIVWLLTHLLAEPGSAISVFGLSYTKRSRKPERAKEGSLSPGPVLGEDWVPAEPDAPRAASRFLLVAVVAIVLAILLLVFANLWWGFFAWRQLALPSVVLASLVAARLVIRVHRA